MAAKKSTGRAAKAYKQGSQAGQGKRPVQLSTKTPRAVAQPGYRKRAQTAYGLELTRAKEYQAGFRAGQKAAQGAEGPKRSMPRKPAAKKLLGGPVRKKAR